VYKRQVVAKERAKLAESELAIGKLEAQLAKIQAL
jgi:BMFP domain-containing protein YqiC